MALMMVVDWKLTRSWFFPYDKKGVSFTRGSTSKQSRKSVRGLKVKPLPGRRMRRAEGARTGGEKPMTSNCNPHLRLPTYPSVTIGWVLGSSRVSSTAKEDLRQPETPRSDNETRQLHSPSSRHSRLVGPSAVVLCLLQSANLPLQ